MIKRLAIAGMLLATPAAAEIWATGDCMTSNGKNIRYALHDGKGMIAYDDEGPYEIFSKRDGEMGVITHIGNRGNMVMAVDLNTGRGYIITQFDNGNKVEKNISCRLGSTNR